MSKGDGKSYTTMSKFSRIHLEEPETIDDVDAIISDIKHLHDRPVQRPPATGVAVSAHLVADAKRSMRGNVRIPKSKPKKEPVPVKTFARTDRIVSLTPEANYNPNFSATLPTVPQVLISGTERKVRLNPGNMTQSEMLQAWNRGLRDVALMSGRVDPPEPAEEPEAKQPRGPGIISKEANRDSFFDTREAPPPGHYTIERSLDKHRVVEFSKQAPRKEARGLPDRVHHNVAQNIDYTKPRAKGTVPFAKQTGREMTKKDKQDLWAEIEAEQKELLEVLHPPGEVKVAKKKPVEPFARQRPAFEGSPFEKLMGPQETRDLQYDVEKSLKALDKKVAPMPNFGRRLDDCERTVYVKTDAPDAFYPRVREQWAGLHPSGTTPLFKNMGERKSAYDYMPKTCGGPYTFIEEVNEHRTPVVMDRMGERKLAMSESPMFLQKRSKSQAVMRFV